VAAELKAHAEKTQRPMRALLQTKADLGQVEVLRDLWIGNAVQFRAEPAAITALADQPGIDYIRAVVDHGLEAYEDRAPVAPAFVDADSGPAYLASYPFYEDFETGVLGPDWTVNTSADGYVAVTADNGPIGDFHVVMASAVSTSLSNASITVTLDLTGQTDVGIRFEHKEFGDEDNTGDGVFISADGSTYYKIYDLTGSNSSSNYRTHAIELDAEIANLGLSYTSTFKIRFRWQDDYDIPTDGFAFDNIEIAEGVGEPPPPGPEANIEQLQAPQLWALGYDGAGMLIVNADSGSDMTHPDLVNRFWVNAGEIPGNGVDDDGNGYVDDINGYDFDGNDGDPSTFETHGTQTGGLMVGDGTNGIVTGMAPGGSMAVCRINGEDDMWAAQQFAMVIGADVISSSHSYKWPFVPRPDYHMHRQVCEMELAAGIIHANSIGNQGQILSSYPIPFNISAPGNCPQPWGHPDAEAGGRSSVMGCAGIHVSDDSLYLDSGQGPSAWEDITDYDAGYPNGQDPAYWDYPYGGFGGGLPALIKPDACTYTDSVTSIINGGGYASFSGTSAATPQLGGGMLLLRDVQPEALPRHVDAAIELSAVDLGPAGKDNRYGAGKLQVFDAARRLLLLGRVDNPAPSIGDTVTFDLFGQPGGIAISYIAAEITAGNSLNLVPPFFKFLIHFLDGAGTDSFAIGISDDPVLIGLTVQFQFLSGNQNPVDWGPGFLVSVPEAVAIGS
jgi:hypothetical protein